MGKWREAQQRLIPPIEEVIDKHSRQENYQAVESQDTPVRQSRTLEIPAYYLTEWVLHQIFLFHVIGCKGNNKLLNYKKISKKNDATDITSIAPQDTKNNFVLKANNNLKNKSMELIKSLNPLIHGAKIDRISGYTK
jgi:hypothetical protein